MGLESLPSVVFLLLPGFLSWGIFCWGTVTRKISQVQHIFISLLLSVIAFSIAYPLTNLFTPLPGYMRILSNPEMLSIELLIAVYVLAVLLGFLLIRMYKNESIARQFKRVGLDLYGHEDTWYRLFHKADYVTVHLKDGNIVAGWPTYFSQTGDKETAELYLTKIHYYEKEKERWVKPSKSVGGLLINTDSISHIEFRKPETVGRENVSPTRGNSLPVVLSRADFLRMGILLCSFGLILFRTQDWITVYFIAGMLFITFSLIPMSATLLGRIRRKINKFIERRSNTYVRNLPTLVEWLLVLGIFTVALIDGLIGLINLNQAVIYIFIIFGVGILWYITSLIEFYLRLRLRRSA